MNSFNRDNGKAEEYANRTCYTEYDNCSLSEQLDISDEIKQAYLDGLAEGRKGTCKKILEEVRTHEGIEQMTKFYIGEIIKNLGVENAKEDD